MPVTYSSSTKASRMSAVVTAIGASGKLKWYSAADALLATFDLAATAGTVSGSVLTLSDANGATAGILNTVATADGTATKAAITTSSGTVVVSGLTVGVGAGYDFQVDSNVLTVDKPLTINSATLTHTA